MSSEIAISVLKVVQQLQDTDIFQSPPKAWTLQFSWKKKHNGKY